MRKRSALRAGPLISTFSIVGFDPAEPAWGIAIASRFLAVGAATRWGAAGVGAVVIQAHFNARNGSEGVELLRRGLKSDDVIETLMAKDRYRDVRQMAVVDSLGRIATYTGKDCNPWAGGAVGENCAAQGNTLVGPRVVQTIVEHFTSHRGSLARRLVGALAAGEEAGGDNRGRQSAALLVLRPDPEELFDVFSHHSVDLRVDDHPEPLRELARLLDLYELIYLPSSPEDRLPAEPQTLRRLQEALATLGFYSGEPTGALDEATRRALTRLSRVHNLRQRLSDAAWIDRRVLAYVEEKGRTV
ncbi:MAG TPA: DUF1028 domain-containing protein [bacterium]|jgi:uncharacterized Ntn-hydrolase superfamily protein|nr:DUF1028 domain-containing protein [bacterium]